MRPTTLLPLISASLVLAKLAGELRAILRGICVAEVEAGTMFKLILIGLWLVSNYESGNYNEIMRGEAVVLLPPPLFPPLNTLVPQENSLSNQEALRPSVPPFPCPPRPF